MTSATPESKAPKHIRTPRGGIHHHKRSAVGKIAAVALGAASAGGLGYGLTQPTHAASVSASERVLPDESMTPGAIDARVRGNQICSSTWAPGPPGEPPVEGGSQTYSQTARHTSQVVKEQAFAEYGIENPHDGGQSYEIDHRIPLSLGGRDVLANLWPESRSAQGMNAWAKDRLEYRLYNLVCHPPQGEQPIPLREAQQALQGDWTQAYETYCGNEDECRPYGVSATD
jgi:hypothetical protein